MVIKEKHGLFSSALLFTLYLTAFLLTESAVNIGSEQFMSVNVGVTYTIGLFCTALGYILFSVSRIFAKSQTARKALLFAVSVIFVLSVILFLTARSASVFIIFSILSLSCFGYIGGMVHYNLSVALRDGRHTGKTIGLSVGTATLIQFAVQNLFNGNTVLIISILLCVIVILSITLRAPDALDLKSEAPAAEPVPDKELIILIAAVLIMSVIMSVNDGIITTLHSLGAVNVLSWPRLFYAL